MDKQNIVTINGRSYDTSTGMPVPTKRTKIASPTARTGRGTSDVHKPAQRSQTLNRRTAKKTSPSAQKRPAAGRTMDIAKSATVSRFAAHPQAAAPKKEVVQPDKPASHHPMASRAMHRHQASTAAHHNPSPLSAKQVKEHEVAAALAKATPNRKGEPGFFRRHSRKVTILIITLAILAAGAYLTVTNLPVLSVTFAASQAGIKATYPSYTPDGYHLEQPITYSDGKVELDFVSNTGNGKYTVKQSRSSWDSSAVLSNIVRKEAGDDYVVTQDSGLTIYTYQGNAAWVNAGILYVIENSAPLADQIRSIATSL